MNARHVWALITAAIAWCPLVGCGSSFTAATDGGQGDVVLDGTSTSDATSSSEGAAPDASSEAGTKFPCAGAMLSCQEGTDFCLTNAETGTSCKQISIACSVAADPCICAAGASTISLDQSCITNADSRSPNECQITCSRHKDAGSGSMDAGSEPPQDSGTQPKDAASLLDVHVMPL